MVEIHNVARFASLWKSNTGQKRKNVANASEPVPHLYKDGRRVLSRSRSDPMSNLIFLKRRHEPSAPNQYVDSFEVQDFPPSTVDPSIAKDMVGVTTVDDASVPPWNKDVSVSLDCLADWSEYVQLREPTPADLPWTPQRLTSGMSQNRSVDATSESRTVILSQPRVSLSPVRCDAKLIGHKLVCVPASVDENCCIKSSSSSSIKNNISGRTFCLDSFGASALQSKSVERLPQIKSRDGTSDTCDRGRKELFVTGVSGEADSQSTCLRQPTGHAKRISASCVSDRSPVFDKTRAESAPPVERHLKPARFASVEEAPPVPPRFLRPHSAVNDPVPTRNVHAGFRPDHVAKSKVLTSQHFVQGTSLNTGRRTKGPVATLIESNDDEVGLFWPNPHAGVEKERVTDRVITQEPLAWKPRDPFVRPESYATAVPNGKKDDRRGETHHDAFCHREPEADSCLGCVKSAVNVMTCMWCLNAACYHFVTKDDVGYNGNPIRETLSCTGSAGQNLKRVAIALACIPCMPCLFCYPILWGCTRLCGDVHSKDTS